MPLHNHVRSIELTEDLSHVLVFELTFDFCMQSYNDAVQFLTADEIEKAENYQKFEDGIRYAHTRSLLKKLIVGVRSQGFDKLNTRNIQHVTPYVARHVSITTNSFGKPYVPENDVYFNVSHSGSKALIIISETCNVGVDIEESAKANALQHELQHLVYSTREMLQYQSQSLFGTFAEVWSAKEAVLKAYGTGFHKNMTSFTLVECSTHNADKNSQAKFHVLTDAKIDTDLHVYPLHIDETYSVAIATAKKC